MINILQQIISDISTYKCQDFELQRYCISVMQRRYTNIQQTVNDSVAHSIHQCFSL